MALELIISFIGAASALLGTLVGGLVTFWVQERARKASRRDEAAALALSLAAEIEAYLDLIAMRRYILNAEQLLLAARAGFAPSLKGFITDDEYSAEPFPVANRRAGEIGLLDANSCTELAKVHSLLLAVRATVLRAERGFYDDCTSDQLEVLLEQEIEIWKSADARGRSLAGSLRQKYWP